MITDFRQSHSETFNTSTILADNDIILNESYIVSEFSHDSKFYRNLSDKHRNNAKAAFGFNDSDTIIGMFDTSLFRSCKTGVLFTKRGIYLRSHMGQAEFASYGKLVLANMRPEQLVKYECSFEKNTFNPFYTFDCGSSIYENILHIKNKVFNQYKGWSLCQIRTIIEEMLETVKNNNFEKVFSDIEYGNKVFQSFKNTTIASLLDSVTALAHMSNGNFAEANRFADKLPWVKNNINQYQNAYVDDIIETVSDLHRELSQAHLLKFYNDAVREAKVNAKYRIIMAYTSIRLHNEYNYQKARQALFNSAYKAEIPKLDLFRGYYYNRAMYDVFRNIESGNSVQESCYTMIDSIGLTPLHYAIILKNESALNAMLDSTKCKLTGFNKEKYADSILNYTMVAIYTGSKNIERICMYTDKTIINEMCALKKFIDEENSARKSIDMEYKRQVTYRRDSDRHQREYGEQNWFLQDQLDESNEIIDRLEYKIEDLERKINALEIKIASDTEKRVKEIRRTFSKYRQTNDAYNNFILSLYNSSSKLARILNCDIKNCYLYVHDNHWFITPTDIKLNLDYYDRSFNLHRKSNAKSEDIPHNTSYGQKPYGDRWFSPEAYRNEGKLKEEYLKLAKKYHPDVNKKLESTKIFQEISRERDEIMKHMNL